MPLTWFRLIFTEKRSGKSLYLDFQADKESAIFRYRKEYKENLGRRVDWKLVRINQKTGCVEEIIALNEA